VRVVELPRRVRQDPVIVVRRLPREAFLIKDEEADRTTRAGKSPTLEVSQEQKAADVRKNEMILSAADGVCSHGSGSQCCHVVRPLCGSRSIRGWSGGYPRGADLSVPWPWTSTPAFSSSAIIAASSGPVGSVATAVR